MAGTCNHDSGDQDDNADDTELPKLVSTEKPDDRELSQWQEP